MNESKIETAKGLCVIALTRYLMERFEKPQDEAYQQLISMEIYQLLMDEGTGLFLETNEYLVSVVLWNVSREKKLYT